MPFRIQGLESQEVETSLFSNIDVDLQPLSLVVESRMSLSVPAVPNGTKARSPDCAFLTPPKSRASLQ